MSPLISVVVPIYNRESYILETVGSLREQTYQNWEGIFIDDASTDRSYELVAQAAESDPRIKLYRREDKQSSDGSAGAQKCRNLGFEKSQGEWIVFLDSDDLLDPNCLQLRLEVLAEQELDYVAYVGRIFHEAREDTDLVWNLPTEESALLRYLSSEPVWQTAGAMWRADFLRKQVRWLEGLPMMQDLEFHSRMLMSGARGIHLPKVDHYIRVSSHPSISDSWHSEIAAEAALMVLESLCGQLKRSDSEVPSQEKQRLARYVYFIFTRSFRVQGQAPLQSRALDLAHDESLLSWGGRRLLWAHSKCRSVLGSSLLHLFHGLCFPSGIHGFCSPLVKLCPMELLGDPRAVQALRNERTRKEFFGGDSRLDGHLIAEAIFHLSSGKVIAARNALVFLARTWLSKLMRWRDML
ncbi:MAG: glycosyltransferase family 2 protein [Verrucomicrobiales bacterium]